MALSEALSPFVWGAGGSRMTPEQLAKQREIEDALLAQGVDTSPVGHWTQGLARVANAMAGSVRRGRLEKAEAKNASESQSRIAALLGGMGGAQGTANFPAAPGGSTAARDNPDVGSTIDFARAGNSAENKQAFIASLMPAAMEASKRTGVDPRIIVAQAAQETGWGKSAPGNNFFGIKSHGKGGGQNLTTHEVINGQRVKVNDSFRTFGSPADSVAGYADFILENPRYRPLMQAQGLDAQLAALGASGYATDPNYAASVGAIARGIPMPAVAANEAMATGQPIQTASLDPSAGIAEALAEQGLSADGPQAEAFARLHQTTPRSATPDQQFQVGAPGAETPAGQRVLSTMMDPQPMGGSPMPLQTGSAAPQASPPLPSPDMAQAAAPQQRVAQAMMGGRNEMSGNVDVPVQQGMNPAIIEALSSPYASEQERRIAGILLQQQLDASDPNNALDAEFRRAQIANIQSQIRERDDPNARDKFGNSVIWGQDADGKWVAMQPSSGGGLVPATTPDGINLVPPGISNLDLGNQFGIRDRAGNIISTVDKNLTAAEAEKAAGKAQGEAQFDLPRVEQNALQTLAVLERMKTHPGREGATGFIQGALPSRSADQVDFQSLVDQTQGQSFLQAFQMLKGGGQITEAEGQKATVAISRLGNQRLSDKDYLQAIADLKEVINNGLARARKQAGVGEPAPASGGADYKSKYGLD